MPKKKPDVMETRVGGGSVDDRVDFALETIENGGEHVMNDVFRAGEYVDASGVTKGKGPRVPSSDGASRNERASTPGRDGAAASVTSAPGTRPAFGRRFPSRARPATTSGRN